MNTTSATATFGPLVGFFAGILAGKGVFGLDATAWTTVIGSIAGVIATLWGVISSRKSAQVSAVAAMPEVQSIKLEPSATADLVQATPANVSK